MSSSLYTRYSVLLAAAMHTAGAIGIIMGLGPLFSLLTPFNLLTMFGLLLLTAANRNKAFYIFFGVSFLTGLITEIIGVNTSYLFGHYSYGSAFGPKVMGVPLLIGMNWFVVVYASGMIAAQLRNRIASFSAIKSGFAVAFGGAFIATAFDYLMEPAAVKLGFWEWDGGAIPVLNYLSWFGISFLLLVLFQQLKFKHHPFAVYLLLIQALFFSSLRMFL